MNSRLISTFVLAIVMFATKASSLGLVLSGGGAKGAYEVGVWQALHEAGLGTNVEAVSGTSIGAVNAALFASWPDPKGAETLWLENIERVFVPNDRILQVASERKFAEFLDTKLRDYAEIAGIPVAELSEVSRQSIEKEAREEFGRNALLPDLRTALKAYQDAREGEASDGLCDGDALRSVLETSLPKDWPGETPRVYVTSLANRDWTPKTFCLNEGTSEDRILRLLASTAIPVFFPPVVIDDGTYVDGGWEAKGGDNVPLEPILEHHSEIKTVVIVYLDDAKHLNKKRFEKNRAAATAAGVRLVEIVPSENIGRGFDGWQGVFDASPETAKHLIELGRKDAHKKLREAGLVETHLDN